MKNISKKVAAFALAAALLIPTFSASAEKLDAARFPAPDSGTAVVTSSSETQSTTTASKIPAGTRVAFSTMQSSILKHRQTNADVRGWLWMPNSNMSMPVVQGKNNDYYFGREWNGTDHPGLNWKNWVETSTYLDYRVQFGNSWAGSSNNIVLYGHNWTNLNAPYEIGNYKQHEMFAQLASFTDITYARNNPYAYFSTDKLEGTWKIFAVAYHERSPKNIPYNTPNLIPEQFSTLVNEYKARSLFNFDVDIKQGDTILTLTTCTRNYANVNDEQRFTVAARLLRPGESDQTAVTINHNPTIKQPSFFA